MLVPGAALLLPGVSNALAARVVADLGFPVAYVTGAGIANTFLGVPDNGLVTMTELVEHVAAIRDAFPGPLVVDMDTGFGNALNTMRAVRALERAGANALQIEDQVFPKRCGHFAGKEVIPAAEMVAKIKAAVDARWEDDLLIVARTDAIATDGFEAALERATAYREAGADVTFVEAPTTLEEIADIPRRLPWPQLDQHRARRAHAGTANEKLQGIGLCGRDLCQCRAASVVVGHAGGPGRAPAQGADGRRHQTGGRFLRAAAAGAQG